MKQALSKMARMWELYFVIGVMLVSFLATFQRNLVYAGLNQLEHIGTLNRFLYSCIYENLILALLAPGLTGLIGARVAREEERPWKGLGKSAACSAAAFVLAYLLMLLVWLLIDPAASVRTDYTVLTNFRQLYDRSMLLYCFCYIAYAALYAAAYGALSYGIIRRTGNQFYGVAMPLIFSYICNYFVVMFPAEVANVLFYMLPMQNVDIVNGLTEAQNLAQIGCTALFGVLLTWKGRPLSAAAKLS